MHCCGYPLSLLLERPTSFKITRCTRYSRNSCVAQATRNLVSRRDRPENSKGGERGTRPLYFQQSHSCHHHNRPATRKNIDLDEPSQRQSSSPSSPRSVASSLPLTPYEFLGTASVLPPHARHLSPCLGAALAASPLAGNLMRLGQRQPHDFAVHDHNHEKSPHKRQDPMDQNWATLLSRTGFLANNLFFQLIRESPIHIVRNKSMPAVYLTPEIIGCLLGYHHQQVSKRTLGKTPCKGSKESNAILKKQLKRDFGIKSNRIHHTEWTGISLARWMDLVIPFPQDSVGNTHSDDIYGMYQQSLVSALWLIALWGTMPSKESLLGYYEALERAGIACYQNQIPMGIPDTTHAFTESDLCRKELENSMNRLLEYYLSSDENIETTSDNSNGNKEDPAIARALELVCAAIVLQQQPQEGCSPPIVPNGYFSFDGGDTKADCAEVVVREILTLLLWDDTEGIMDVSRLPSTASPKLVAFLHRLNQRQEGGSSLPENKDSKQEQKQQRELGLAWFDLLSDLPHCDYLAVSPNGRKFELAPTSESISKALWHLFVGGNRSDEIPTGGQPWTSMHNLTSFWLKEQPSHPLFVKHDRLKHQSRGDGSRNGEKPIIMEHELISLHLHKKAIEIRLRCDFEKASGMAAVTHLMKPKQEGLIDPKQVEKLQEVCVNHIHNLDGKHEENGGKVVLHERLDPTLVMLCLALQPEHERLHLFHMSKQSFGNSMVYLESLWWLATPYGADRRELKAVDDSSDSDREMLIQSRNLLRERILLACRICKTHPSSGAHLLSWILQESPAVIETSSSLLEAGRDNVNIPFDAAIERALLSLPASVLDNDFVLEAIESNWACFTRGRFLTRAIRWKLGKLALWQVLLRSKFFELADMFSLSRSIERRDRTI